MSKVTVSKFYVGDSVITVGRAVEELQQFSMELDTVRVTAAYTVQPEDDLVLVTTGGSGVTITLPTVTDAQRKSYFIKKIDTGAGAVTIQGTGSEQVDAAASINIAGGARGQVQLIPERNENAGGSYGWWTV